MSLIGEWLARHLFDLLPDGVPVLDDEDDDDEEPGAGGAGLPRSTVTVAPSVVRSGPI